MSCFTGTLRRDTWSKLRAMLIRRMWESQRFSPQQRKVWQTLGARHSEIMLLLMYLKHSDFSTTAMAGEIDNIFKVQLPRNYKRMRAGRRHSRSRPGDL